MARLDIDRQQELEPKRVEFARKQLEKLGFKLTVEEKTITFLFNGHIVKLFPFTGWHTGKSIKDGRGLENLIKQLKK